MLNPARGTAKDIRAECPVALEPIFDTLCTLIREQAGSCVEIAWPKQRILSFGMGPKKMSQHYCYIAVYATHINLGFYHGASLADPDGLLEGTGKGLRHVKVSSAIAAGDPALVKLVRAAVADRALLHR